MKLLILLIFATASLVQSRDYDIENHQVCSRKPFIANFPHNCSRKRIVEDVQLANTNQILFIYVLLPDSKTNNISLTIRPHLDYGQNIYFIFLSASERERTIYFTNHAQPFRLSNNSLSTYLYNSLTDNFNSKSEISLTKPTCTYLKKDYLPSENISRLYYIYTNQSILDFDFSVSTNRIPPVITVFETCYGKKTNLTPVAIVLIVLTSVIGLVTVIFISFCLYRQVAELRIILRNWYHRRIGKGRPVVSIE